MASRNYIEKRREISRRKSKLGVEARRRKMQEHASEMRIVATVTTSGPLGDHAIELLDCVEPMVCLARFDGKIRSPRTASGFVSLLGRWVWNASTKAAS